MGRFFNVIALVFALFTLIAATPDASAQRRQRLAMGYVSIFRRLDLNSDQINRINGIIEAQNAAFVRLKDGVDTAKVSLFDYLKKGGADQAQITTLTAEIGTAVAQLHSQKVTTFMLAYAVLTSEQKAALANLQKSPLSGGPVLGIPEGPGRQNPVLVQPAPATSEAKAAALED